MDDANETELGNVSLTATGVNINMYAGLNNDLAKWETNINAAVCCINTRSIMNYIEVFNKHAIISKLPLALAIGNFALVKAKLLLLRVQYNNVIETFEKEMQDLPSKK